MSVDMKSPDSDRESDGDAMDDDDEYGGYNYYENDDDLDLDRPKKCDDPEYFEFELLQIEDSERLLNEEVEALCSATQIAPFLAKTLLHAQGWQKDDIIERYKADSAKLLIDSHIMPTHRQQEKISHVSFTCPVCLMRCNVETLHCLTCGHHCCDVCWDMHFQIQIKEGITTGLQCMAKDCSILVPEDFIFKILSKPELRERYTKLTFCDHVKSHPELRFCPGPNCSMIIRAAELLPKKTICSQCKTQFCFKCGIDYHAPTECDVIKRWLTKCADDSETANYISAHTKDCPKCNVCIEKNQGCNHMQCSRCKHDFCWMCMGDWKTHGSEYYECSRFKENPNIANESVHVQAREALKKYLFYFERWENHSKSLTLEEQTTQKITTRIQEKVMNNTGTWIDWQYLLDAAALLEKCRYTLKYTYPFAYYMEKGGKKELFEYQQAQLEAEVENLSWKIEHAEITHRGDLENQMDVAEKRRLTLLNSVVKKLS